MLSLVFDALASHSISECGFTEKETFLKLSALPVLHSEKSLLRKPTCPWGESCGWSGVSVGVGGSSRFPKVLLQLSWVEFSAVVPRQS